MSLLECVRVVKTPFIPPPDEDGVDRARQTKVRQRRREAEATIAYQVACVEASQDDELAVLVAAAISDAIIERRETLELPKRYERVTLWTGPNHETR